MVSKLIGPPGVGKTAILEGLASRIVSKEVPESLHHKRVLSIDLSAIMAGSGIRGQFEEKFKALLKDIEAEVHLALGPGYCADTVLYLGRERHLLH